MNKIIREYRRVEKLINATDGHMSKNVVSKLFSIVSDDELKALKVKKDHIKIYKEGDAETKYKVLRHYIQQHLESEKEMKVKKIEHAQKQAVVALKDSAREIQDKIFLSPKQLFHVAKGNTFKSLVLEWQGDFFATNRVLVSKIFSELKGMKKVSSFLDKTNNHLIIKYRNGNGTSGSMRLYPQSYWPYENNLQINLTGVSQAIPSTSKPLTEVIADYFMRTIFK